MTSENFWQVLQKGHSALLKNITSDYHYHTVNAPSEKLLDLIQEQPGGKRISGRIEGLRTDQFPGERKRERIV